MMTFLYDTTKEKLATPTEISAKQLEMSHDYRSSHSVLELYYTAVKKLHIIPCIIYLHPIEPFNYMLLVLFCFRRASLLRVSTFSWMRTRQSDTLHPSVWVSQCPMKRRRKKHMCEEARTSLHIGNFCSTSWQLVKITCGRERPAYSSHPCSSINSRGGAVVPQ